MQNRFVMIIYKYHKASLRVRGTRMGYKSYTIAKRQIRKHTKKSRLHHFAGITYSKNLQSLNQTTLKQRRKTKYAKTFLSKIQISADKIHDILPEQRQVDYNFRTKSKYNIPKWTSHFKKSFLPYALEHYN